MQFKGQLLLPDEPGPGLRVNIDVAAHHLAVEGDDGGLGAWPLETVDVQRLEGDVFALTVAGEALRFVADDTIGFAYSGVPTIERVSPRSLSRSGLRSLFGRLWNGPEETAVPPLAHEPVVDDTPTGPIIEENVLADEGPGDQIRAVAELVENFGLPVVETADVLYREEEMVEPSPIPVAESPWAGEDLAASGGCPAIRGDGRRCESPILTSSGYCYPHDPKRGFEDKYEAALEARAQLKHESTARLNRIYGRLDKAMRQVERGELDPETAMAMAQIAGTMCAILGMDEPTPGDH